MNLKIFTYTNKGGKQNNEDYLDYYFEGNKGAFVLADGLGGHGNGDVASKLVVQTILPYLEEVSDVDIEYMEAAFQKANQQLLLNQELPNQANMRTTAVVLHIEEDKAVWGHLGDSRLYYISDNHMAYITKDHSVTYKKYLSGEIRYTDINSDEDRPSLLGVFGNKDKFKPEFVESAQKVKAGDAFLLCSDGFWEYVFDEEILIDFLKSESPRQWAEYMLLRHIKRTKPSNDNYSLVAVFVE